MLYRQKEDQDWARFINDLIKARVQECKKTRPKEMKDEELIRTLEYVVFVFVKQG